MTTDNNDIQIQLTAGTPIPVGSPSMTVCAVAEDEKEAAEESSDKK